MEQLPSYQGLVSVVMQHGAKLDSHEKQIAQIRKMPRITIPWDVRVLLYALFAMGVYTLAAR